MDSELGDTLDEKALDRDLLRKNTPSDISPSNKDHMKHSNSTHNAKAGNVGSDESESGAGSKDASGMEMSSNMGNTAAAGGQQNPLTPINPP